MTTSNPSKLTVTHNLAAIQQDDQQFVGQTPIQPLVQCQMCVCLQETTKHNSKRRQREICKQVVMCGEQRWCDVQTSAQMKGKMLVTMVRVVVVREASLRSFGHVWGRDSEYLGLKC